jgi:uncharacterized repeat protein (TIGR01451 family)
VSIISDIGTEHLIRYYINVTNDGEETINNVTVNDTFPEGLIFVSCSLPSVNTTNPYDNCYIFNVTHELDSLEAQSFYIVFTIPANFVMNGTTVINFANTTSNQSTNSSANCSFKYGLNNLPVINWQYPPNGNLSVGIPLANISVGISDADGDQMNLTFYTNKSEPDSWTASVNSIGQNLTIENGTYNCNQTFNNTPGDFRYNTRWKWGYTIYYWWVNINDGYGWTNATYYFRTTSTRYDMDASYDVTSTDCSITWMNRDGEYPYLGIYDVDATGDITSTDVSIIWANRGG